MIKKGRIIMNTVGKKMLSADKMNRFSHKVMSTDRSSSSQCKSSEKKNSRCSWFLGFNTLTPEFNGTI